jgi:hypothetical protein
VSGPHFTILAVPASRGIILGALQSLCRHTTAGFGTIPACRNAVPHITNSLAVASAFKANLGAFAAQMLVVRRTNKHEMSRGSAYFSACNHKFEMQRLAMLAPGFKAMVHGGTGANAITGKTAIDTLLHFRAELSHGTFLSHN